MAEIVWTEEAVQWLEEIFEHVAAENPRAAGRVTTGIFERAQILRDFPLLGYLYRKEADGEVRVLVHGH
jgi:plasmid stabilization system protein ParE